MFSLSYEHTIKSSTFGELPEACRVQLPDGQEGRLHGHVLEVRPREALRRLQDLRPFLRQEGHPGELSLKDGTPGLAEGGGWGRG